MDGGSVILERTTGASGDALSSDDGTVVTGRLRHLPERGDPAVPGLVSGRGWVALMYARGRMDARQLAAAVDIGRALALEGLASASGLRALDPTKLVVDGGGPVGAPLAPVGGSTWAAEVDRLGRWRRDLRGRGERQSTLRGRRAAMFIDLVVTRVITGEATPAALDAKLGLREGRTRDAVLRHLADYAAAFGLGVAQQPS